MARRPQPKPEPRVTIIEAVTAPLGFFVLALLIIESFLAIVLVRSELEPEQRMTGVWIGVGLFIYLTAVVAILVWFKPTHVTYDKTAHLHDRGKIPYGTEEERVSATKVYGASEKKTTDGEGDAR